MAISRRGMLQAMMSKEAGPGGQSNVDTPGYVGDLSEQPTPNAKAQRNPEDAKTVLAAAQADPVIAALARIIGLDHMTGGSGLPNGQSIVDIPGGE